MIENLSILNRRLLFVSGKGGTGKTSLAMAIALAASKRGKKVLLVSLDTQETYSQIFGTAQIGTEASLLEKDIWAICITPDSAVLDFFRKHLKIKVFYQRILDSQVFQYFYQSGPGIKEYLIMGKIWELLQDKNENGISLYDIVVVDSPATGHSINFLKGPWLVHSLIGGPMKRYTEGIYNTIKDPKQTGVLTVTLPAEMPVMEAIQLYHALKNELSLPLGPVFLNAFPEFSLDGEDREKIIKKVNENTKSRLGAKTASALCEVIESEYTQYECAHHYLSLLKDKIPLPVVTLPCFEIDKMDLNTITKLSELILEAGVN